MHHLGMYLEELGGKKKSDTFPISYCGEDWRAEILGEEVIAFTTVFKVNAVYIRFMAENSDALEELLNQYRKKTFRAGG